MTKNFSHIIRIKEKSTKWWRKQIIFTASDEIATTEHIENIQTSNNFISETSLNAQPKKQKRGEKETTRNEPLEKTNTEDNTNDNLLSWETTVKAAAGAARYVLFKRCAKWPVLRVGGGGGVEGVARRVWRGVSKPIVFAVQR